MEMIFSTQLAISYLDKHYGVIDESDEIYKNYVKFGIINEEDRSVTIFSKTDKKTSCEYHDRLIQQNPDLYEQCMKEVFGRYINFDFADPEDIEKFLQKYHNKPKLKLVKVLRSVNISSGYPLWSFSWE